MGSATDKKESDLKERESKMSEVKVPGGPFFVQFRLHREDPTSTEELTDWNPVAFESGD